MKITIPHNPNSKNTKTNYVVLVDTSGSTYGFLDEIKETVIAVNQLVDNDSTITIGYFSGQDDYAFPVRGLNIKDNNLNKLIQEKFYSHGLTNYIQSLNTLEQIIQDVKLTSGNDNFEFYFLSDGMHNTGGSISEVYKICKQLKTQFNTKTIIGYGSYYDRNVLLNMSENLDGQFIHVSNLQEMNVTYTNFMKSQKTKKNIPVDQKYDLVWQVTENDIIKLTQHDDNSVDVFETKIESNLYAINFNEIDSINVTDDRSTTFNYSLAYVLSQANKANLGVKHLRRVGALNDAKLLQKAFTVAAKGQAENDLKIACLSGGTVISQTQKETQPLSSFIEDIKNNLGKVKLNTSYSSYNSITKKGEDVSEVEFKYSDELATIVDVTENENRPNISFLTVREGYINNIKNPELLDKIRDFNARHVGNEISLPIKAKSFKNYTFVANGDFNFDSICIVDDHPLARQITNFKPAEYLDIFDESDKTINIKDFVALNKQLIKEKAHASVLNFYIKNHADTKHIDDIRVKLYGQEGAQILEDMGLNYDMVYSPKRGSTAREDENADYITFQEIDCFLKGASKINAKDSYEKYQKTLDAKAKQPKLNPGDVICHEYFKKYDDMLKSLDKQTFVETIQTTLKGVKKTVDLLKSKVSQQKFYLITTNSWFDGIDKADEIEYDGLMIKTKETKEYI